MKSIFLTIAVVVLLFCFIRFIEKKSLYFPLGKIEATPHDIGLEYEEVYVSTKDGVRVSCWYVPSRSPGATFLFSHGNGGNISHRLEKIKMFNDLGVNVLIFDYRGYGMSKGSPSEAGLYLDAEAVYNYLVNGKKIPPQEIIGYGESLGGAVIIDLAGRHKLGGVIIEGGFTSIRDMAKNYFPFVPSFVYKTRFDSTSKIRNVKAPALHFHSINDDIVPFRLGKKLFDNAPGPKEFVELQGGHNDAFLVSQDVFMGKIDSFISRL
ncbi:MAG: alpha/beta hydrolase, partial [Nitrospirae bacterium]|nr:alpha/beta hydrolase [Nitrospirota bacterium]